MRRTLFLGFIALAGLAIGTVPVGRSQAAAPLQTGQDRLTVFETMGREA